MKSFAADPVSRSSERTRMRHKYRLCRVAGVHMANPRLVRETPWNHGGRHDLTIFKNCR